MIVKKGARLIILIAERAAEYAAGKISVWYHYQAKEPAAVRNLRKEKR